MSTNLQQLRSRLASLYDEREAKAITQNLLEVAFGYSLTDIVCGKMDTMSETERTQLDAMMQRLEQGEPLQYVLGQADFCGRTFRVASGVLIPRPETEELCAWITHDMQALLSSLTSDNSTYPSSLVSPNDSPPTLLDIGTGSGCIAITLALNLPQARVAAWDLSDEALQIATDNAHQLQAVVDFCKQDVLSAPQHHNHWNLIVSNPPYICRKESSEMAVNVLQYEPDMALFVPDNDPLLFYRAIAVYATSALKIGGKLYFEINPLYAKEMQTMLEELGLQNITFQNDQFGKIRMMRAEKITHVFEL